MWLLLLRTELKKFYLCLITLNSHMNLRTAIFDSTDVALAVTWNLEGVLQGNNEKQRVASSLESFSHWTERQKYG